MAKKTTPRAKPKSEEPVTPSPELGRAMAQDSPASPRRRAAKAPNERTPKASAARPTRTAGTLDAAAAATGSAAVRRPRRAGQLPTQAVEQTQTPAPVPPADTVSDDEIRMRAYFLSLERGPHAGSDMDLWLEAERELRSKAKSKR